MNESEIKNDDILKGLTQNAFNIDYYTCKELLYNYLKNLKLNFWQATKKLKQVLASTFLLPNYVNKF